MNFEEAEPILTSIASKIDGQYEFVLWNNGHLHINNIDIFYTEENQERSNLDHIPDCVYLDREQTQALRNFLNKAHLD